MPILEQRAAGCDAPPMRCTVTVQRDPSGIVARCEEFPGCEGRGATAGQAVERLRAAVLFWLEACPCDTTADPGLVMEVVEDRSRSG